MGESEINPEFCTDAYSSDKPMKTEDIRRMVEKESPIIQNTFKRNGFIGSKEYAFITYANFHGEKNCALDEETDASIIKNEAEKNLAMENLKYVENYLKERAGRDIVLDFAGRRSNECVLYDKNKGRDMQRRWKEYFD